VRANESPTGTFNRIARLLSPEFRRLDDRRAELLHSPLPKPPPPCVSPSLGYHSVSRNNADTTDWVQVDLGSSQPLDAIVLVPAASPSSDAQTGYYFPVRFRIEISEDATFAQSLVVADYTAEDYPAPGTRPVIVMVGGRPARHIRVTVTRMSALNGIYSFALGEILALRGRRNVAFGQPVSASHSVENPPVWRRQNLSAGRSIVNPPLGTERSQHNGFHCMVSSERDAVKWVQVDLGMERSLQQVVMIPAKPTDFPDRIGFGFPARFRVEAANDPSFQSPILLQDSTEEDYSNPGDSPVVTPISNVSARYVRLTTTRLWERTNDFVFALAELQVYSDEVNVALNAPVEASDSIDRGLWRKDFLVDGYASQYRLLEWPEWLAQEALYSQRAAEILEIEKDWEQARDQVSSVLVRDAAWLAGLVALVIVGLVWRSRVRRRREAEQLRDRIARDLHDEVGSNLGSILLLCQLAQGRGTADAQKDLAEVGRIAAQTADSMRDLVWVLGHSADTSADLLARLREAAASLLAGIDYTIDADDSSLPKRLSPEFKRQLLFGFKEALHNVVRHSGARRAFIRCWLVEGSFWIEIRDDGRGFDPDQVRGGTGLRSLRMRAESLGGELQLESKPGQGTVVRLRLPTR